MRPPPRVARGWVNPLGMQDYLHGAESDSGYLAAIYCAHCDTEHFVTLSKIGRFLFECRGAVISGEVKDWRRSAVLIEKEGLMRYEKGETT
jgi:hypothetical protein